MSKVTPKHASAKNVQNDHQHPAVTATQKAFKQAEEDFGFREDLSVHCETWGERDAVFQLLPLEASGG